MSEATEPPATEPQATEPQATEQPWLLMRQDDNGNVYRVSRHAARDQAQAAADPFEARGHKQLYWVQRSDRSGPGPTP